MKTRRKNKILKEKERKELKRIEAIEKKLGKINLIEECLDNLKNYFS